MHLMNVTATMKTNVAYCVVCSQNPAFLRTFLRRSDRLLRRDAGRILSDPRREETQMDVG